MRNLVKIFKALSNEIRLKIVLYLLKNKEATVTEISNKLKINHFRASRNLKILENAYLVKNHIAKNWVFYSINKSPKKFHSKILKILSNINNKA